jgi:glycosyltransferase involved in cell wall biosynthesis
VLFEAFAAGLPVVATAVGGVAEAGGDAILLVPPGDADAPAARLRELAADEALRDALVEKGLGKVRAHTLEAELRRTARFLRGGNDRAKEEGETICEQSPIRTVADGI